MSIIHDALKKVQRGLSNKPHIPPAAPLSAEPPKKSDYVYATPSVEDIKPEEKIEVIKEKPNLLKIFKSLLAIICAAAITAGSIWYIYEQVQSYIPNIPKITTKSLYKLIPKKMIAHFKAHPKVVPLKPMGQITIKHPIEGNSPLEHQGTVPFHPVPFHPAAAPVAVQTAAPVTVPVAPSITLNVHGIMSDARGNVALINDQVYQEGDDIDGVKIVKINLNSIIVNDNGVERKIPVKN